MPSLRPKRAACRRAGSRRLPHEREGASPGARVTSAGYQTRRAAALARAGERGYVEATNAGHAQVGWARRSRRVPVFRDSTRPRRITQTAANPVGNISCALQTIHKTTYVESRAPARSRPGTLAHGSGEGGGIHVEHDTHDRHRHVDGGVEFTREPAPSERAERRRAPPHSASPGPSRWHRCRRRCSMRASDITVGGASSDTVEPHAGGACNRRHPPHVSLVGRPSARVTAPRPGARDFGTASPGATAAAQGGNGERGGTRQAGS